MNPTIINIASSNQQRAYEIINEINIYAHCKAVGISEVNLIGSLKMGLLMNHLDIDFHIYSSSLNIKDSFAAISRIAQNKNIVKVEYHNLIDTEEQCIEWHLWYHDRSTKQLWQIDIIHILKGSKYDGFFERIAQRINEVITEEHRHTILKLKAETPEDEKVMGIDFYQAVIKDGVTNYHEFKIWREKNKTEGINTWMP